jgi:hypothetical protein
MNIFQSAKLLFLADMEGMSGVCYFFFQRQKILIELEGSGRMAERKGQTALITAE